MKADVTLRASCLMPERLIERAIAQGARFDALRRPDERTLIAQCDAVSADILLSLCERFSIPAKVLSRRGTSALAGWARRRATLLAAFAICAAMCGLFFSRVWIVNAAFSGENAALGDRTALEAALARMDIRPGMLRQIDADLLAQEIRADAGNLSYVGVHLQGVRLLIEAVPEVPMPQLYDVDAARDLVSDRDGIVLSAVARSGELCVQPGDAVRRGQLLIRGEELVAKDETRPIAALGEVVVRAWYEGEAQLPLNETRVRYTGRTAISSSLELFGLSLPIVEASGFESQRVQEERLAVGGLFLPLELARKTCREIDIATVRTDEARLRARLAPLALADAALRLSLEGPEDYEIAQSWIDYEINGGTMFAHAVYEIHANAAVTRSALNERPGEDAHG